MRTVEIRHHVRMKLTSSAVLVIRIIQIYDGQTYEDLRLSQIWEIQNINGVRKETRIRTILWDV